MILCGYFLVFGTPQYHLPELRGRQIFADERGFEISSVYLLL